MAVALVHADADISAQMAAIEIALIRTSALYAGMINRQYKVDAGLFADIARVEFERITAEAKVRQDDNGVRH
jgi:hypothetical protein